MVAAAAIVAISCASPPDRRTWAPPYNEAEIERWGERCGELQIEFPQLRVKSWGSAIAGGQLICRINWNPEDKIVRDMSISAVSAPGKLVDPETLRSYMSLLAERLPPGSEAKLLQLIPSREDLPLPIDPQFVRLGRLKAYASYSSYRDNHTEAWRITLY
jgi:hypothetical protein